MAQASIGASLYRVILELVSEPKHVVVEDDGLIKVPLVVMRGSCLIKKGNVNLKKFVKFFRKGSLLMISLFTEILLIFFSMLPTSLDCCRHGPPQLCCQVAWQFEDAPCDTAQHCQSHPLPDTQHPHCLQEILSLVIFILK